MATPATSWTLRTWLGFGLAVVAMLVAGGYIARLQFSDPPLPHYRGTLRVGWESMYPYHYLQGEGELARRTGVDTELIVRAFAKMGYRVLWQEGEWTDLEEKLRKGEIQALPMALKTSQRQNEFYFSTGYLDLYYAAFYRLDSGLRLPADPRLLHQVCRQRQLRIGYTSDYNYPEQLQRILDDPEVAARSIEFPSDADSLSSLGSGGIDLVFCDSLMGSSYLVRYGWEGVGRVQLDMPPSSMHVAFDSRSVAPEVVQEFDRTILEMHSSGETGSLIRSYFYPSLLALLTESPLFREIPVLAGAFAAISGIFMAYRERLNLLGSFVLAAAPAAGGGVLRDLVAGRRPVGVVGDPLTLIVVAWLVLLADIFFKLLQRFPGPLKERVDALDIDHNPVLVFFDALGLAAYTVIGVLVAMQTRCEPLWLWGPILAAASNGGGSIIRDVVRGHYPIPALTRFYAQVAVLWGAVLSWFFIFYSNYPPHDINLIALALVATMVGVVLTRYLTAAHDRQRLRSAREQVE